MTQIDNYNWISTDDIIVGVIFRCRDTDMIRAKDGDFFVADWLRNRNTLEFIGIWEKVYNPSFNYGEFAIIKSQAGLNRFKISVKEFVDKLPDSHRCHQAQYYS